MFRRGPSLYRTAALPWRRGRFESIPQGWLLRPVDLDTVTEHLELPTGQAFDLVIATNIFIYYDILDQCLALANVQRMLRTGGYLLSNNFLPILPVEHMRAVGYHNHRLL